jgi:circadian clock protein KaiB
MSKEYILKLYITGDSANSQSAIKNLNGILEKEIKNLYKLKVVDVLKRPNLAEQDRILATPTLMKVSPAPAKRIIGDLSDWGKVRLGLELNNEPKQLVDSNENIVS